MLGCGALILETWQYLPSYPANVTPGNTQDNLDMYAEMKWETEGDGGNDGIFGGGCDECMARIIEALHLVAFVCYLTLAWFLWIKS